MNHSDRASGLRLCILITAVTFSKSSPPSIRSIDQNPQFRPCAFRHPDPDASMSPPRQMLRRIKQGSFLR